MLNRIRRFGFRLLYNECAFTYDLVSRAVSLGCWRSWQRTVLPILPPPEAGTVLELAHGTGDLQLDILQAGYRAIALDRSRSMGRLAQRKLSRSRFGANLIRGEAGCLPIQSDSIAAIVCAFPTSFILEQRALLEIQRVLKRDAPAVIVLSGMLTDGGLRARFIRILYCLTGQVSRDSAHEELRSAFKAPGLSIASRDVCLDGSLAQLVILKKTPPNIRDEYDDGLDMAPETCYIGD